MITVADLEKSEDVLLLELAEQLNIAGVIRFSGPLSDDDKRERARGWLSVNIDSLRNAICGDARVVAYLQDEGVQNMVDIAAVVVDCLSASTLSFPVGTLAVLLVKGRLKSLCSI